MATFPKDIFTEPEPDVDTLANLGPLAGLAGIWTSAKGLDDRPTAGGAENQAFIDPTAQAAAAKRRAEGQP